MCLWVRVDPKQPLETRAFRLYGTGHTLDPGKYIGTFHYDEGHRSEPDGPGRGFGVTHRYHQLVMHLFETALFEVTP